MELQLQIYAGLLLFSALLNIRQPNVLALIAVSALYLLILPLFLEFIFPTEVPDTVYWYGFLAVVELSFMISAIALCCGITSYAMAALSGWIIVAHGLGAWAYLYDGPFYEIYPVAQISGEICQILAPIVLAPPSMRLIDWAVKRVRTYRKERENGRHFDQLAARTF